MRSTRPSPSLAHSHSSRVQETYFLSGLPSPGQPLPAANSNYKSWAARSAQNAVWVRFGPRHFVISLADTIRSWGGGETTILSLRFWEALAYQQTIRHPNMPSVEFPFSIYIQGKEFP